MGSEDVTIDGEKYLLFREKNELGDCKWIK